MELKKGKYLISTDKRRLNFAVVHGFLSRSYWAKGRTAIVMKEAIKGSDCYGLYSSGEQIGFARVITDRATFAYIADVFILENYRGRGLGKWLVRSILKNKDYILIKRWLLATEDAQSLYSRFGFRRVPKPTNLMQMKVK